MVIFWLFATPVIALFVIYTAFLALCTARAIIEQGVEIPRLVMLVAKFWFLVGVPADVVFNWTVGAWTFGEWRGFTFSSHVQWRVNHGCTDYETLAWKAFLNAGAPGHIREREATE